MNTSDIASPIVSVIIPTTGDRISWLQRAVDSAIAGWTATEVEVVIVLNRNMSKLQQLQSLFVNYSSIKIIQSTPAGASRARNKGLSEATGKLIRFLDDDDYLFPKIAMDQCFSLLNSDADLSSFAIHLVDENGQHIETRKPIHSSDSLVALALPERLQIPVSFVFKKALLDGCHWQEDLSLAEDTVWLLSILTTKEIPWNHSDAVVGVWFQHTHSRLSRPHSTHQACREVANALIHLSEKSCCRGSSGQSSGQKNAIATGLWACFAAGFKFNPILWSGIARKIRLLEPSSTPNSRIYTVLNQLGISPVLTSWVFLPAFWLLYLTRIILANLPTANKIRAKTTS